MSTILRCALVVALIGGSTLLASTTAMAEPAQLPRAGAELSAAAPTQTPRYVPTRSSKKACTVRVKGKHGHTYKRYVPCRSKQKTKQAPPNTGPKANGASCNTINGVHGGTRPGHRAALDYMASGSLGQSIANEAMRQMRSGTCNIKYFIWQQTICFPDGGCQGMEDRGSPTQNHRDHVHIEY